MWFEESRSLQQQEPASASAHIPARIPTLDGWRAVAIFAVICFHGRYVFFPGPSIARTVSEYGYLGVDAFFAISGFLICTLISTVLFPQSALGRLLELPFMRWAGALSYSIYLWQQLFLQPPRGLGSLERTSGFYRLQQVPLNVVCILLCACASHYLLERRMMALGRRLSGAWASIKPATVLPAPAGLAAGGNAPNPAG
jgi:peptidoglycan/LPS O-acetylase OafA/YrhL